MRIAIHSMIELKVESKMMYHTINMQSLKMLSKEHIVSHIPFANKLWTSTAIRSILISISAIFVCNWYEKRSFFIFTAFDKLLPSWQ